MSYKATWIHGPNHDHSFWSLNKLFYFIGYTYLFRVHVTAYVCICTCHSTCVELSRQLRRVWSLLPSCGSQGPNLDPQAWWRASFPHWAISLVLKYVLQPVIYSTIFTFTPPSKPESPMSSPLQNGMMCPSESWSPEFRYRLHQQRRAQPALDPRSVQVSMCDVLH